MSTIGFPKTTLQFAYQDCDGLSNTQLQTCQNPRSKKFCSSNVEVGKKSEKSFCKVEEDEKKVLEILLRCKRRKESCLTTLSRASSSSWDR
jgi:hypothetical protein